MKIPASLLLFISGNFLLVMIAFGQSTGFTEKSIRYLSGTDNINTITWDFYCTGGRKSGSWTTIEVPLCWEQQGFGTYNYGRDYHTYGRNYKYADEKGMYRYEFTIPKNWIDKKVNIVFEGSMTDTEVKINGRLAGDIHQGSFYRFSYDISDKLNFGQINLLEVTVSKMSSNKSVNAAERYADYWIFGGIFRPVYLEAFPKEHIRRVALAANAEGSLSMQVFTENLKTNRVIYTEIIDKEGKVVATKSTPAAVADSMVMVHLNINDPLLWSAETPALYKADVSLCNLKQKTLYKTSEKFGFRTIEVRHGDGIYINNTKVKMKGINRHVFWPETGRTVNREIDLMDVKLIKEMNMNAVRCSHYPPDKSFLEICDSLGLYVINELAGWQNSYDTDIGAKLVKEMVLRDVNHPSIIFWSNGNEGGHNMELITHYAKYDPSNRIVIHAHNRPGNDLNGIDCDHYEPYEGVKKILQDSLIYMTTEFLHCQNDGGGGAGLFDYWELMRQSPKSGGGFLWAYLDEGIVRTDFNNTIDVNGVNAPDGIVGPHRQKEGSFYSIKEIFSPVHIPMKLLPLSFNGEIPVENRFEFLNLNQCRFEWKIIDFYTPSDILPGYKTIYEGSLAGPNVKAGENGRLSLKLPSEWNKAEALLLKAFDPYNNEILNWSWKIKNNETITKQFLVSDGENKTEMKENDSLIIVSVNKFSLSIDKMNGLVKSIEKYDGRGINFNNGPVLCAGKAVFADIKSYPEEDGYVIEVSYTGDMKYAKWKLYNSGWIELNYEYSLNGEFNYTGISFNFPEDHVMSARWLGNGPYRTWKNRTTGGTINVWQNAYNNTTTGYSPWIYPEFKGYYSNITWMELNTVEGKILIASKEENLFIRLFDFYSLPGITPHPELPPGNISFLDNIPPTGTKMSSKISAQTWVLGPQSKKNEVNGTFSRTIYFFFGILQQ